MPTYQHLSLALFFQNRNPASHTKQTQAERIISKVLAKKAVAEGTEYATQLISDNGLLIPRVSPDITKDDCNKDDCNKDDK